MTNTSDKLINWKTSDKTSSSARATAWEWKQNKTKKEFSHKMVDFIKKNFWKINFYLSKSQTDKDTGTQLLWNNNKIECMSLQNFNLVTSKR